MIHIEDTQIKVGNAYLPGLFRSITVTGEAQVEEQDVPGSPVKKKQAIGYEDAKITIELQILDGVHETKEYKLQELQNLFKAVGQGKPIIHSIVSAHLAIRGITKVIVKSLESKETSSKKEIIATLTLWEYAAMTVTATKAAAPAAKAEAKGNVNTKTNKDMAKQKVQQKRQESGYQRGAAPKLSKTKREAKSPAKDTAKAADSVKAIRNMKAWR